MTSGNDRPSISPRNIFDAVAFSASSIFSSPKIPLRISAAVAAYETQSERIIGWIQLAGVLVFASLYLSTYSGFTVHHAIEPAPLALALYGGFTLWRLKSAYGGGLSKLQQYASAAIDVSVLIALIFSFPYQYGEPAALYLKAPTLFYVFILIALRSLKFDPGLVIFSGLWGAAGWAVLIVAAARQGAPLTGDYREYMTSLSLLPGAELEKIAAIIATAAVLALGVDRARALLFRTAIEEAASADLSKFVGREAAGRIRAADDGVKSGDGEIRRAAIMFIDLRGFTLATKDLPPRSVIALLQDYQSRLLPIIEAGGGAVDKFLGDGILVSFGAAAPDDRACAHAVETAMAAVGEIDRWKAARAERDESPIDVGIALSVGEIVYGAVGHGDRLEYTVIGDAVNLAAKLEKHAKTVRARVLATRETSEDAARQGARFSAVRTLPAAQIDGAAAPVALAVYA